MWQNSTIWVIKLCVFYFEGELLGWMAFYKLHKSEDDLKQIEPNVMRVEVETLSTVWQKCSNIYKCYS